MFSESNGQTCSNYQMLWQVNPNSKWQASIGRAVSIISSITESVFGKTGDNGIEEHEAQDDSRSMVIVALLQLLSTFVPTDEGVVSAIGTHINDNALNFGEPKARHDTGTPRAENNTRQTTSSWNDSTQGDSVTQTGAPEGESDNESDAGDGGKSDSEGVGNVQDDKKHKLWVLPTIEAAHAAHTQLDAILNPR